MDSDRCYSRGRAHTKREEIESKPVGDAAGPVRLLVVAVC